MDPAAISLGAPGELAQPHCGALLERANVGRLRLQHWEAEAPNAIMGWTVFQSGPGSDITWCPRRACAAARN